MPATPRSHVNVSPLIWSTRNDVARHTIFVRAHSVEYKKEFRLERCRLLRQDLPRHTLRDLTCARRYVVYNDPGVVGRDYFATTLPAIMRLHNRVM